jgi:hypothetical protein
MSLLVIGIGLIAIAAIIRITVKFNSFSHLWFEIKKAFGIHNSTPH